MLFSSFLANLLKSSRCCYNHSLKRNMTFFFFIHNLVISLSTSRLFDTHFEFICTNTSHVYVLFCFFCFLFKRDLKTYHLLLAWSVEELSFAKQEATKCNCYSAKQSSICLFDVFSFFFTNSKVFSINTSLSVQRRQESMSTSSWQTSRIVCMEYMDFMEGLLNSIMLLVFYYLRYYFTLALHSQEINIGEFNVCHW